MPIIQQQSKAVYVWGGTGGSGHIYTSTVNFAPGLVHAQVSLSWTAGAGAQIVGIQGFRYRPTPTGPETEVDFGYWANWKSIVGAIQNMSSVTWGLAVGSNQEAKGRLDIYRWG